MTEFVDLDGAFKSLTDTLQNRLSPFFEEDVSEAWMGAIGRASAIARRTTDWNELPETAPEYEAVITALDSATRHLASARVREAILSAIAEVLQALAAVGRLLDAL